MLQQQAGPNKGPAQALYLLVKFSGGKAHSSYRSSPTLRYAVHYI
jgi:hypothetical protein